MPVIYRVVQVRDGRSTSVRTVTAEQDGRVLLTQTISFSSETTGPSHVAGDVPAMPHPDAFTHFARRDEETLSHRSLLEMRRVPPDLDPRGGDAGQALWLRVPAPIGGDATLRRAAVAFASDFALLEPVALTHGLGFGSPHLRVASLDHSLWWLADSDVDEWLLVVQDSPWSGHGRGVARASVFSRDGSLVALVQQEGIIRVTGTTPLP